MQTAADTEVPAASGKAAQIQEQLKQLRAAQKKWEQTALSERAAICRRMKKHLSMNAARYAGVISAENGKTQLEALTQEIIPALDTLDFLARSSELILKPQKIRLHTRQFYFKGKQNFYQYQPYGIIGILGTWNYAFFLSMTQAVFALVAGNAVYLKSSELSGEVNKLINELLNAGGFPEGSYICVCEGAEFGSAFVATGCDKYILTGAKKTGKAVQKVLSENSVSSVMELSGCDPYVVFPDADFDLALRSLIWASYQYSGQTCVAPRRLIVQQQDRERCVKIFRKHFDNCAEFIASQGKLRSEKQAAAERQKVNSLIQQGGRIEAGRFDAAAAGAQFNPVLISGVSNDVLRDMDFMAPVIFLIEGSDTDDMIRLASDSESALGASVWTRNRQFAAQAATQIPAGQLWVNDGFFSVAVGSVGFGGFKASGFGKTRGKAGLLEMVQEKFVSYDTRKKRLTPQLPPYQRESFEIVNGLQKILFSDGIWSKCKASADFISVLMRSSKKS